MSDPRETYRAVAAAIRARMDAAEMSQADLSRKTGIHSSRISVLLSGERNFSLRTLHRILEALGADWIPEADAFK